MSTNLQSLDGWSLAVASNDETVLAQTLLSSPAVDGRCDLITMRGFRAAGEAYNSAIDEAKHDIVVFAHQDVYLPETWAGDLKRALDYLAEHDPQWGVLGVFGVVQKSDRRAGYCYSTGLRKILGKPFAAPIPAESLDELVLIVRKSSGLRYDERLCGFHLYGTDICLEARRLGLSSYIIPAFCIHNSIGIRYLSKGFWRSYLYLRNKWRAELPVVTCCTRITRSGWPILHHILSRTRDHITFSVDIGTRTSNPGALYQNLHLSTSNRTLR